MSGKEFIQVTGITLKSVMEAVSQLNGAHGLPVSFTKKDLYVYDFSLAQRQAIIDHLFLSLARNS